MHYRLGWPLGRIAARAGVPISIRINVIKDAEAGVYVGTSSDVQGLVVEAETLDQLMVESIDMIQSLLAIEHERIPKHTVTRFRINSDLVCA